MGAVLRVMKPRLMSEHESNNQLASILTNAIIVDENFNIQIVSKDLALLLEFDNDQLKNKSINYLAGDVDVVARLKKKLDCEPSEEFVAKLYSKHKTCIRFSICGFHLGFVCDLHGYIILKVKNVDEKGSYVRELKKKKIELDRFIYRAAHDLRGPLATIKGLINLLKMREDDSSTDLLVKLLDEHSYKMDQRLYQLLYLAQADHETELPTFVVDFKFLKLALSKVVEQNSCSDFLELTYQSNDQRVIGFNEVLIKNLLTNFLLHLLSLHNKISIKGKAAFTIRQEGEDLQITIEAIGFAISKSLQKSMRNAESIYTDVINYPHLINFYAAQKIVRQLNGQLRIRFFKEKHKIVITIPVERKLSYNG